MKKRNVIRFTVLGSMMMVLTACPYQSKVPITKAEEKVDKKLMGDWIAPSEMEYDNPTYYSIDKFSKMKYDVVQHSYSQYDSAYTDKRYFMHSSTIDGKTFVNVEDATANDGYYLYYMEKGDDEFTLFEISDNVDEQFTSSADLEQFIKKNMHLSFFYGKSETKYVKKSNK